MMLDIETEILESIKQENDEDSDAEYEFQVIF